MGKRTKKLLPWLATGAVCLLAAIALFILLPYLRPSHADNDKATTTPDRNQQQIDENPSTDDRFPNDDNNSNTGDTTTTPTDPNPAEPIDPEPSEPVEPVNPTPTEPEPTDPEPTFVLTVENLRGTVWEDTEHGWQLSFNDEENNYTFVRLSDAQILLKGAWELKGDNLILNPKSAENKREYSYANNTFMEVNGFSSLFTLTAHPAA